MREIKMKPFKVTDPSGKEHLAYAKTSAGAISAVQESQREEWSARPATGEELYIAARDNLPILNPPACLSSAPAKVDAFSDME